MKRFIFVLLLLFSCTVQQTSSITAGWKTVEESDFSFQAPPDVVLVPVQGIDSYVGEYKSPNISISFDFGWYSDPLEGVKKLDELCLNDAPSGLPDLDAWHAECCKDTFACLKRDMHVRTYDVKNVSIAGVPGRLAEYESDSGGFSRAVHLMPSEYNPSTLTFSVRYVEPSQALVAQEIISSIRFKPYVADSPTE